MSQSCGLRAGIDQLEFDAAQAEQVYSCGLRAGIDQLELKAAK